MRVMTCVKAGFHQRWSRSHKRSCKNAYDLVKIKNRSRKWSHKHYRIGRIRMFPFSPDSTSDSFAYVALMI